MREIKFRVWDGHKMHYPPVVEIGICGVNGLTSASFQSENGGYTTSAYVMQFTGLYDRNGVEIYEGDICKDSMDNIRDIHWSNREGGWCSKCLSDPGDHPEFNDERVSIGWLIIRKCEVIGNIHENPELLEVE